MVRFKITGKSFDVKDDLKKILPKTSSRWSWKKNHWELVIQSNQNRKKFLKKLELFCTKYKLGLSTHEWDGFNKHNNYV